MSGPELDAHVYQTLRRTGALEDRALWLEMGGLRFAPLAAVRASLKRLGAFGRKFGDFAKHPKDSDAYFAAHAYANSLRMHQIGDDPRRFTLYSLTPWKQAHS